MPIGPCPLLLLLAFSTVCSASSALSMHQLTHEPAFLNTRSHCPPRVVNSHVRAILCASCSSLPRGARRRPAAFHDGGRLAAGRLQGPFSGGRADVRRRRSAGDEDGGLDIARRRVGIEGRVARIFDYQAEYELGAHEWRDVYLDYRQFKAVQVRAGVFKLPFGLEENTSATNLDFVYRARISARLAPGRDRGVSVHGRVLKDVDLVRRRRVRQRRRQRASVEQRARVRQANVGRARAGASIPRLEVAAGRPAVRRRRSRAATCRSDFRRFARARCSASPSTTRTCGCTDAGNGPGWRRAGSRAGCRFSPSTSG